MNFDTALTDLTALTSIQNMTGENGCSLVSVCFLMFFFLPGNLVPENWHICFNKGPTYLLTYWNLLVAMLSMFIRLYTTSLLTWHMRETVCTVCKLIRVFNFPPICGWESVLCPWENSSTLHNEHEKLVQLQNVHEKRVQKIFLQELFSKHS